MNLPKAIATLSWQSFIGDLIPDRRRGAFFSERSRILTFVGMIVTICTGVILNNFDKTNAFPYQILFLLIRLVGGISFLLIVIYVERTINKKPLKQFPMQG